MSAEKQGKERGERESSDSPWHDRVGVEYENSVKRSFGAWRLGGCRNMYKV